MLVFACTAVVFLAGAYMLTPLFKDPKGNLEVELLAETDLDRLLNRKAVVYSNLRDLEFDYKMGRLSDADFARLEAGYKNEAATILQQLDQLGAEKDLDETIEKEVTARKTRVSASPRVQTKAVARCPSCGAEAIVGKKFCADCGHTL